MGDKGLRNAVRAILVAILLTLAAPAAAQDFNVGLEAYQRGDFEAALQEWRPLAEQGHAEAQFNLGNMYRAGLGVSEDHDEAAKLFRKAAEQGNIEAQLNLVTMYTKGEGVARDQAEAMKWLHKAAEQGDFRAHAGLANVYFNGLGVAKDVSEALKWWRSAAEQGDYGVLLTLGEIYQEGRGVAQDYSEAARDFGAGIKAYLRDDYAAALDAFRPLAERGATEAQTYLGHHVQRGPWRTAGLCRGAEMATPGRRPGRLNGTVLPR